MSYTNEHLSSHFLESFHFDLAEPGYEDIPSEALPPGLVKEGLGGALHGNTYGRIVYVQTSNLELPLHSTVS